MLAYHRDDLGIFGFQVVRGPDGVTVQVEGDVDISTCPLLDRVLRDLVETGERAIAVDLADVAFMGPRGLLVLLAAKERLAMVGGTFTVLSPSPAVRKLMAELALEQELTAR